MVVCWKELLPQYRVTSVTSDKLFEGVSSVLAQIVFLRLKDTRS